jgi:hypothetical protein
MTQTESIADDLRKLATNLKRKQGEGETDQKKLLVK